MYLEKIIKIVLIWTMGLLGKALFLFLILTKRARVTGYRDEKLNHQGRGLIIICNHPSLYEPFLLPFLFASPRCLFSLKAVPYSLVDKKNYYDKWWFRLFRFFSVPIERENPRKEAETIEKTLRPMLEEGKILILFPEATRTFRGINYRGGKYSRSGQALARFPQGLSKLFYDMDCLVLLVWTRGGDRIIPNEVDFSRTISRIPRIWRQIKIKVGDLLEIRNIPEKEIIDWLEDTLLSLAEGD
jgi:1-acyl-sn-glycerol-3-phosphate acyltransferase